MTKGGLGLPFEIWLFDTLRYSGGTVVDHYRPLILGLKSISPRGSGDLKLGFQTFGQQPKGLESFSWIHVDCNGKEHNISRWNYSRDIQIGQTMLYVLKTHKHKQKAPENNQKIRPAGMVHGLDSFQGVHPSFEGLNWSSLRTKV